MMSPIHRFLPSVLASVLTVVAASTASPSLARSVSASRSPTVAFSSLSFPTFASSSSRNGRRRCANFCADAKSPLVSTTSAFSAFACVAPSRVPSASSSSTAVHVGAEVDSGSVEEEEILQAVQSMKAREIKRELESLSISTEGIFEKDELAKRLARARSVGWSSSSSSSSGEDSGTPEKRVKKKKKRRRIDSEDETEDFPSSSTTSSTSSVPASAPSSVSTPAPSSAFSSSVSSESVVVTPFQYASLDNRSVQAKNAANVFLRPSAGQYASIKVGIPGVGGAAAEELALLVDTACSGMVITPAAARRHSSLRMVSNASATMMAAGGAQRGTSVARSERGWIVGGKLFPGNRNEEYTMIAVQDIGALPGALDGIMGLSLLNQFACVDFDYANSRLVLHRNDPNPPLFDDNNEELGIVARGALIPTRLGVYAVEATLDGRGPVRLLVDTGAASTFLNWKGVSDLGLSRASAPYITENREAIGAMGADDAALALTHRLSVQRRFNIPAPPGSSSPGLSFRGGGDLAVDIGDLPVLEAVKAEGVGGILGTDVLMRCDVVRLTGLNGDSPKELILYQK